MLLMINKTQWHTHDIFTYALYLYTAILILLTIDVIMITFRFKQLFVLMLDNDKPDTTE